MNRYLIHALLLSVTCAVSGCTAKYSTPDVVATVPVSGTLTFQNKPLEFYQVVFMPVEGTKVATGISDPDGKFKLGTNDSGDGAPVGKYKIAISFVGPPSTSTAGTEQIVDDPSKLPKPKIKIPAKYADPATSGLAQEITADGLPDLKLDLK
jgi:hypothetical protein